ncbi:lipoprotein [Campylobacter ureolyticus]|uniref:LptM family lipoprotein n=1 Tax=Campylobacter ureolyticus TaxID=827 RepID=UPI0035A2582D
MNFFNYIFNTFHRGILAKLLLIFLVIGICGCGYKGPPVYTPSDTNTTKSS